MDKSTKKRNTYNMGGLSALFKEYGDSMRFGIMGGLAAAIREKYFEMVGPRERVIEKFKQQNANNSTFYFNKN